jgi:hypothetical protein
MGNHDGEQLEDDGGTDVGMMPRANTDRRSKAPPENMSMKPKSVPLAWAKKAARAEASIPGVGT